MGNEVYLKNIANISAGSSAPKEGYLDTEGVPFIRAGNLEELINGVDINTLARINEKHRDKLKLKKASENSILFAKSGMSSMKNRVYKVERESYFVNHLACVTVKDKNVDVDYLKYFFEWFKPSSLVRDESYPSIRLSDISNIKINLPSIKIQEKVAAILNETNKVLKLRQQQIEALSVLKQSVFLDTFGDPSTNPEKWDLKTFKDICTVRQGLQIPIAKRLKEQTENAYKYITVQYLNGNKEIEYIKNPRPNVICNKNDVLMTRTGNTGRVISNVEGVFHNNFFLIDFDRELLDKTFLIEYLNTEYIQKDILRRAGTSTIPDLNHSEFYKINIFLPTLELQKEFAGSINRIDNNISLLEKASIELMYLYNSLLYQAFNGELFKEEIKA